MDCFLTMDNEYSKSSNKENGEKSSEKRKGIGRMRDTMKSLRASTHEIGKDCKCKRYQCFDTIPESERFRIIREFNKIGNYNEQNIYLSSLITVCPVKRRRPRYDEDHARANSASYAYRVRVLNNEVAQDVRVCFKAFISLHGITPRRIQCIQNALVSTDQPPVDKRGKHANRPHKLADDIVESIKDFIISVIHCNSHFSIEDSEQTYLPEELNIAKLHRTYAYQNPEHKVSYETFRGVIQRDFNITFGYPKPHLVTEHTCKTENTALR